jgi:23S rRNA pseudouridine1911/1915/1917 synthase
MAGFDMTVKPDDNWPLALQSLPVINHSTAHHSFLVSEDEAGSRLDEYLASQLGWLSRIRIGRLIAEGNCLVNGVAGRPGKKLAAGDSIEMTEPEGPPTAMTPEPIPLDIVHEDEHLMVIVKPAGMLVHPTIGVKLGTLANGLVYHLNRDLYSRIPVVTNGDNRHAAVCMRSVIRPGIVHRLDKATSGLMVIAKTPHALSVLSKHFRRKLVKKRYLALLHGRIGEASRVISAPIGRDPDRRPHWGILEGGKESETRLQVLDRREDRTLVELEPVTGRTNQLRIHCAFIGHPIVGDLLYETSPAAMGSTETKVRLMDCDRLFLHASELAFRHPEKGGWLTFVSPLPHDLAAML